MVDKYGRPCKIDPTKLTYTVKKQFRDIECNKKYTSFFLVTVLISLFLLDEQKKLLCCSIAEDECECCEIDFYSYRYLSSFLSITALIFFFDQSKVEYCLKSQTLPCNSKSLQVSRLNYDATFLGLLTAALRFISIPIAQQADISDALDDVNTNRLEREDAKLARNPEPVTPPQNRVVNNINS